MMNRSYPRPTRMVEMAQRVSVRQLANPGARLKSPSLSRHNGQSGSGFAARDDIVGEFRAG
jgi:hypothetical protein